MNRTMAAVILIAAIALPGQSRASFDLKTYREFEAEAERIGQADTSQIRFYIVGVANGIFWANTALQARGQPALYCQPPKFALDMAMIKALLDQEIKSPASGTPYPDDKPIEIVMMNSLITRFPCE